MLTQAKIPNLEAKFNCRFVESNIPGVLYAVSPEGWAIFDGNRNITGDWNKIETLTEELIGLKELYGK